MSLFAPAFRSLHHLGGLARAGSPFTFTRAGALGPFVACLLLFSGLWLEAAPLELVASFPDQQVTGVAVDKTGRVFVNFPDWASGHTISVAEVKDGRPVPFPDNEWNSSGDPHTHFVCVQSVYCDNNNDLWILDPAAPLMKQIVKGGPKLLRVDLVTNKVVQNIPVGEDIAPRKSYLNDVRVDRQTQTAFLTDSGLGAIIVVDLKTGKARRLLERHRSVKANPDFMLTADGRALFDENKKPPQINSDGIALDLKDGWLYFHALTARTLFRVKTADLLNASLSKSDLEAKVEAVVDTPPPDGMLAGTDGSIYLTDLENDAVNRFDPASKQLSTVVRDMRLKWPDSMAWGPDGRLYVTASQIMNMPRFNDGKDTHTTPYEVFRVKLGQVGQ